MKFCANCGTQILDEATGCPQCKTSPSNQQSTNNQHSHTSKKFNKMIIVIPLVVFATALITTIGSYFTLLYLNDIFPIKDESYIENIPEDADDSEVNTKNETVISDSLDKCPASEYGNHDWSRATCQEPSYCYDCNKEKNDKLGNHNWNSDEDGNRYCWDCGLPYDDFVDSDN